MDLKLFSPSRLAIAAYNFEITHSSSVHDCDKVVIVSVCKVVDFVSLAQVLFGRNMFDFLIFGVFLLIEFMLL